MSRGGCAVSRPKFPRPSQEDLRRIAHVLARVNHHPFFDHRTPVGELSDSFVGPPSPVPAPYALGVIDSILFGKVSG